MLGTHSPSKKAPSGFCKKMDVLDEIIMVTSEYASVSKDPINMYASHSEVRTVHFSNNPIFSFATSKITPSEADVMTFFPVSTKSIINNFHIYQYVHYLIM